MADFSLIQQPNFAQAALGGYQAGQKVGKQRQLDTAMAGIDLERPETLLPILRADPTTGAALIGASTKLAAEKRDQASRAATAAYIKSIAPTSAGGVLGGTPSPSTPSSVAAPTDPAAGASAPTADQSGDIVVTAARAPTADPNALRNAAIDADPSAFLDMQSKLGAMTKTQRESLSDASEAFAAVGQRALEVPYAQRRGYIQAQAGYLTAHGISPQQIAGFDPTDDALHTEVGKALGVKGQLDQHNKDLDRQMEEAKFSESKRHTRVEEGQGAQRIGLEGASVGLSRQRFELEKKKAGSAAGAVSGMSTDDLLAIAAGK